MHSGNWVSRKYRDIALEPRRLRMGMRVGEPYGAALRDYFRLKIPVPAVARTLRKSRFALAHISSNNYQPLRLKQPRALKRIRQTHSRSHRLWCSNKEEHAH
jgi:hypothetical protein